MFGLSGVWKGDRRCRVARRKSQAAEAKGWILTTSINVQSVAFGQLAGAREDGCCCQPWAWMSPLSRCEHHLSRFICCTPPPALGVIVSPQEPTGTPQSCCSPHLSSVSKTTSSSITYRSLLLLLGNVCKNQCFLCSISNHEALHQCQRHGWVGLAAPRHFPGIPRDVIAKKGILP